MHFSIAIYKIVCLGTKSAESSYIMGSYTFESSDSETNLGIMKSKVDSRYYLNVSKQHLLEGASGKELISSLHIPLKRIISQCDK